MEKDDPELIRADAVFDQCLASLTDKFHADVYGFESAVRKVHRIVQEGDSSVLAEMTNNEIDWLMRFAHFGAFSFSARLLGRDV